MSALDWHSARNLSRPETIFVNSLDDFPRKSQTYLHLRSVILLKLRTSTAQNMKFSVKTFFSKYEKTHRKLWICSHILKESSTENFIFSWQLEARKTYNKNEKFLRYFQMNCFSSTFGVLPFGLFFNLSQHVRKSKINRFFSSSFPLILHWSFPLRISLVNVNNFTVFRGFVHIAKEIFQI